MEKKKTALSIEQWEKDGFGGAENASFEMLSLPQIQRLVCLLNRRDLSEIQLNRVDEGLRLVLRKFDVPEIPAQAHESWQQAEEGASGMSIDHSTPVQGLHYLRAHMVGVFHPWLMPEGKTLVTAGDFVKAGQIVGIIEALNIFTEITTTVAGCVIEISAQDGQFVEYGQLLMTIDSSD